MDTDKNSDLLEQHLKVLGQKIRIEILKRINNNLNPISYSSLQKEVFGTNTNSTNFAFHLKALKNNELINQSGEGYEISTLGKKIVKNLISIERILNEQNRSIMIRTSKYTTEPFNLDKVETYLVDEGKMEEFHAKLIAKEVRERLSKTNIEYLTTPLMREYINGVLLENGLEEVRHRLTRLGTPPSDVRNLFNDNEISPEKFIQSLGSASSEQFLLLNLLPKELADLYLSSEIVLLNLSTWGLKPLGYYINSESLLKMLGKYGSRFENIKSNRDFFHFFYEFRKLVMQIQSFFSEEVLIDKFDLNILQFLNDSDEIIKIFIEELSNLNLSNPRLSLELYDPTSDISTLSVFINNFQKLKSIPNFIIDLHNWDSKKLDTFFKKVKSECLLNCYFNNNAPQSILNSLTVDFKIKNEQGAFKNELLLLDKIFINLHAIALNSERDDDVFKDTLIHRLNDAFELYDIKQNLITKRLKNQKYWESCTLENPENIMLDSIKAISFFGLNEAVEFHCGIELDRTRSSRKFATNLLKLMEKRIKEKNKPDLDNYLLAQPHQGLYLRHAFDIMSHNYNQIEFSEYGPNILRKTSKLPFEKQISLFNDVKMHLEGGNLFYLPKDYVFDFLDLIKNYELNFKII